MREAMSVGGKREGAGCKRRYPAELVARVKGAGRAGVAHKLIAKWTGIAASTVGAIMQGRLYADVAFDDSGVQSFGRWLKGERNEHPKLDSSGG
jgi:hypothetical protein